MDPMYLTWNCVLLCNNAQAANAPGDPPLDADAAVVALLLQLSLTDGVVPPSLKILKCVKRWDYGVCHRSVISLADLQNSNRSVKISDRSAKSLADLSEAGRSAKLLADL